MALLYISKERSKEYPSNGAQILFNNFIHHIVSIPPYSITIFYKSFNTFNIPNKSTKL